jgi:hypothetical protein
MTWGGALVAVLLPACASAQLSGAPGGMGNGQAATTTAAAPTDQPAAPPSARVSPYVEVGQLFSADLNGGDTVTYTTLAAGVNAQVSTARAQGQVSYRYEHRIGWSDRYSGGDIHSGLARGLYRLTPEISIDAGALATRTRADIRGVAPGVLVGDTRNISQLYSAYIGPVVSTRAGPVQIGASYRLGYSRADTPGFGGLSADQPRLDYFRDSWNQMVTARADLRPGVILPVGLSVSGAYERDDAGQFAQRYQGAFARGDVVYPISPYVALTAGVGYEGIESSQRGFSGSTEPVPGQAIPIPIPVPGQAISVPVFDGAGDVAATPSDDRRRIAYRTDGVYYDAGVIWRPNRRTSVEGHIGQRYGSLSVTGQAHYQLARTVAINAVVYDGIQTFGRQLNSGLAGLPTDFVSTRDAFSQQFNGCTFSTSGTTPGGCLNDVLQSMQSAVYRARGVNAMMTVSRGRNTYGVGLGYANRHIFAPDGVSGLAYGGGDDESAYGQIFFGHALSRDSGLNVNGFVNYYASRLAGAEDVISLGTTASYYRNFGRLGTTASVGLYHFSVGDISSALSAQALIAARYQF